MDKEMEQQLKELFIDHPELTEDDLEQITKLIEIIGE